MISFLRFIKLTGIVLLLIILEAILGNREKIVLKIKACFLYASNRKNVQTTIYPSSLVITNPTFSVKLHDISPLIKVLEQPFSHSTTNTLEIDQSFASIPKKTKADVSITPNYMPIYVSNNIVTCSKRKP